MIAYFDCTSGAAGDMLVAALLDAGASWDQLQTQLAGLNVDGYKLHLADVKRAGLRAKYFHVELTDEHHHHHRDLSSIFAIIDGSKLHERVKSRARQIFTKLAQAEADVHNCQIHEVHFHEVGAVDAIVDIVGVCICLELLNVETVYFSRITVGSGQTKSVHGVLPVPAPATAKLLLGQEITSGERTGELATPTGVAILVTLGTQKTAMPELTLRAIGCGAGSRDDASQPNVVRVMLAAPGGHDLETDEVAVISLNIDDSTGEHLGWLTQQLFEQGALDVTTTAIFMKKNRPGTMLQVLAGPGQADALARFLLSQSTSFGLRISRERRLKLSREFIVVMLPEGKVRVKLGYLAGKLAQIGPEFEDCRKAAERTRENFRTIYARAVELARQAMAEKK